jgi:7-cyano-7-deazaguanine reductase
MANKELDNSRISKHLGQTSQYKSQYDPELLVKEPRSNNRGYLGIVEGDLPFVGHDTWNAYECSFLLSNGRPVTGVVKIVYDCNSPYIVESKSIKLYLNSFNMTQFDGSQEEAVAQFGAKVSADLSQLLEVDVAVNFFEPGAIDQYDVCAHDEWDLAEYNTLEDQVCDKDAVYTVYNETPELLEEGKVVGDTDVEVKYHSALLKSNCRVTSQPDWGDVMIRMKSKHVVDKAALLKYIISFRDECHFHEEICECIYQRLMKAFEPTELGVMCLYARRGGIDINPVRASDESVANDMAGTLMDPKKVHIKTSKQ